VFFYFHPYFSSITFWLLAARIAASLTFFAHPAIQIKLKEQQLSVSGNSLVVVLP
jgi:hypothetical protein